MRWFTTLFFSGDEMKTKEVMFKTWSKFIFQAWFQVKHFNQIHVHSTAQSKFQVKNISTGARKNLSTVSFCSDSVTAIT